MDNAPSLVISTTIMHDDTEYGIYMELCNLQVEWEFVGVTPCPYVGDYDIFRLDVTCDDEPVTDICLLDDIKTALRNDTHTNQLIEEVFEEGFKDGYFAL